MMLIRPESRFLKVNGLRLHHFDWGNPSAPPVVFVHGYANSPESFNGPARRYRDRFHIVATTVRGHGDSGWSPDGAYQYADGVSDLEGIVDQLGFERFTLVGTSMGGIIAMAYAGTHPDRLARLVINDIGPDEEPGVARITAGVAARPTEFATLDDAVAQAWTSAPKVMEQLSEEEQRELIASRLRQAADGRWIWKWDPAYVTQRAAHGPPQRPDLWAALAQITCITLVVWALDSDILSEGQAHKMVEALPRGELVAVPNMVHAPTLQEPAAVAALDRFLDEVEC